MQTVGKSFQQFTKLTSYDIDVHNLKKIYMFLKEAHITENKEENLEKWPMHITIWGKDGECFVYYNTDIQDIPDYPNNIVKIQIRNSPKNKNIIVQEGPYQYFNLTLDFNVIKIFDLLPRPSEETLNDSYLEILGHNESWVAGVHGRTITQLNQIKNFNFILHKRHVYDLILILIIFPATILICRNNSLWISNTFGAETAAQVIGGFFIFMIVGTIVRLILNWTKWLFPLITLSMQENKFRKNQKESESHYSILFYHSHFCMDFQ